MSTKIPLYIDKGKAYVWNSNDWFTLRTEHRICGSLIGSLPSAPRQNDVLGLPLALLAEEAALLVEKGICELFQLPNLIEVPKASEKEIMKNLEDQISQEQRDTLKKRKIEMLRQKLDLIVAGKRNKLLSKNLPVSDIELDKDAMLQEEIDKITELSPAHILVQLPTENFIDTEKISVGIEVLTPSVTEGQNALKYAVYKDLWESNHYVTSGSKFGADYLVYPGDPVKFHATYMVRCVDPETSFRASNYVSYGRLSVAVNKIALFAYYYNDKIDYQTLQWHDSVN